MTRIPIPLTYDGTDGALVLSAPDGRAEVRLPLTERGLKLLQSIAQARYRAKALGEATGLGTVANPTQAIVDQWLLAGGTIQDREYRARESFEARYGAEAARLLEGFELEL